MSAVVVGGVVVLVKVQLVVVKPHTAPQLCVLVGPTFRDLVVALQDLPRRTYVAPNYWLVDTAGIARLRTKGLEVETGMLEPVLRERAHHATLRVAGDGFRLSQLSANDWP